MIAASDTVAAARLRRGIRWLQEHSGRCDAVEQQGVRTDSHAEAEGGMLHPAGCEHMSPVKLAWSHRHSSAGEADRARFHGRRTRRLRY